MKNKDIISEWLKRARSNLERARAEKTLMRYFMKTFVSMLNKQLRNL